MEVVLSLRDLWWYFRLSQCKGGQPCIQWVEARGAEGHLQCTGRPLATKNYPAQNVNSPKVGESCPGRRTPQGQRAVYSSFHPQGLAGITHSSAEIKSDLVLTQPHMLCWLLCGQNTLQWSLQTFLFCFICFLA